MSYYRYILEPYQSGRPTRFDCPLCGPMHRKTFSRYIDTETGEHLADDVGRCSREANCGYHYTPRQHFEATRSTKIDLPRTQRKQIAYTQVKETVSGFAALPTIPFDVLKASRKGYKQNSFICYLLSFLDADTVNALISRFYIGTSKRWDGATVFWWVTTSGSIVGGQVVLFGKDGHTAKYTNSKGQRQRCTRPVHKVLLKQYQERKLSPPDWLINYDRSGEKFPTLFGLHQLNTEPVTKPIAIAEAPATAIVASVYFPQFIWMATGSLSWLNEKRLAPLKGRKVYLFPDLGGFEKWQKKLIELSFIADFKVSDFLEKYANDEQRSKGLDLRDFLVKFDVQKFK